MKAFYRPFFKGIGKKLWNGQTESEAVQRYCERQSLSIAKIQIKFEKSKDFDFSSSLRLNLKVMSFFAPRISVFLRSGVF